jgi:hypothetical protein
MIVFRLGAQDAAAIAQEFDPVAWIYQGLASMA